MSPYRWIKRKRYAEINIVPLVDVLTILIFFFLLNARYHDFSSLQIQLPKIDTAAVGVVDEVVRIGITQEGVFYLNEVKVSEEELVSLLREIAALDHKQTVMILSDEEGAVKYLTKVMDICRNQGLDRFRILSR